MRISVLIPAYNAEATLAATLQSVLDQTLRADEVLVMDDGSTDRTAQIAAGFGPVVTVLRQENQRVAAARNRLIEQSRGELLAFLDSDDLWHPTYLESQTRLREQHPSAVAWLAGHHDIDMEGQIISKHQTSPARIDLIDPEQLITRYNHASGFIYPSFCMIRASIIRDSQEQWFPEDRACDHAEDAYFWYRLALAGRVALTSDKLGFYRCRPGSGSDDRVKVYSARAAAMELVEELYRQHASPNMRKLARRHLAGSHRLVAKHLMGAHLAAQARKHMRQALRLSTSIKSIGLLTASYLPRALQPSWPARHRTA